MIQTIPDDEEDEDEDGAAATGIHPIADTGPEAAAEEGAEEVVTGCFFDGMDGFQCKFAAADARECFGITGTSQARNCKKGEGNKPNFYHHFCFVNYYKEIKGKDLKDDFECNSCPMCKAPSFARKGR